MDFYANWLSYYQKTRSYHYKTAKKIATESMVIHGRYEYNKQEGSLNALCSNTLWGICYCFSVVDYLIFLGVFDFAFIHHTYPYGQNVLTLKAYRFKMNTKMDSNTCQVNIGDQGIRPINVDEIVIGLGCKRVTPFGL